jgi:hypothetical protein
MFVSVLGTTNEAFKVRFGRFLSHGQAQWTPERQRATCSAGLALCCGSESSGVPLHTGLSYGPTGGSLMILACIFHLLVLTRLVCCRYALACSQSPRGAHPTAEASLLAPFSVRDSAPHAGTHFQAESCRDGREKRQRVICCSDRQADYTSRLKGVISHGNSESEVRRRIRTRGDGVLDTSVRFGAIPATWRRLSLELVMRWAPQDVAHVAACFVLLFDVVCCRIDMIGLQGARIAAAE